MVARALNAMNTMNTMAAILSPQNAFKGEKWRGMVMSLISNGAANALNVFLTQALGVPVVASTVLCLLILNNLLGYTLDILFAKRSFRVANYMGRALYDGPVPYSDIATRTAWLLRSFVSKQFYRYVITILIDIFITIIVMKWAIKELDRRGILVDWKYRDPAVAATIAVVTFFLYVNVLRFEWAYLDDDQPVFNLVVMMWVTLALMIFAATQLAPQGSADAVKVETTLSAPLPFQSLPEFWKM